MPLSRTTGGPGSRASEAIRFLGGAHEKDGGCIFGGDGLRI